MISANDAIFRNNHDVYALQIMKKRNQSSAEVKKGDQHHYIHLKLSPQAMAYLPPTQAAKQGKSIYFPTPRS